MGIKLYSTDANPSFEDKMINQSLYCDKMCTVKKICSSPFCFYRTGFLIRRQSVVKELIYNDWLLIVFILGIGKRNLSGLIFLFCNCVLEPLIGFMKYKSERSSFYNMMKYSHTCQAAAAADHKIT
jgi:hypothetical protein